MTAIAANTPSSSSTSAADALSRITRIAALALRASSAHLHLTASDCAIVHGDAAETTSSTPTLLAALRPLVAANGSEPLTSSDLRTDLRGGALPLDDSRGIAAYAGVALRIGDEVVGTLSICCTEPREWTSTDLELLREFADALTAELGREGERREREAAEAALRASEERYRTLVELSADGIFLESERGEILDCNESACRIFGYESRDEMIGLTIADLVPPDFAATLPEVITEDTGGVPVERQNRRKDGSIFPSEVATRLYEVGGERRLFAYVRDITRRKETETLLTIKTRILDAISRGSRLEDVLDLLARTIEEQFPHVRISILLLRDRRLWSVAGPSLPGSYTDALDGLEIGPNVGSCGSAAYLRKPVIVSDIETDPRWGRGRDAALAHGLRACWSQPILSGTGEVLGTFASYYDEVREPTPEEVRIVESMAGLAGIAIERTRAATALQESERRFRTLVERIEEVFLILDAAGTTRYISPASSRITGYTVEERIGKFALDLIHPDDLPTIRARYLDLLSNPGLAIRLEARLLHKDGSWRWISILGQNLLHDPHLRGIVVTYQDITEQRRLEEQLREAQKLEAVGRLAGGVAHDFNNLLNVIGGITHLIIGNTPEDDDLRKDLQEIITAVRQATSLTQQLLAFSRRQVLQPRVLDLDRIVDETSRMLRRVIGEDVQITTRLETNGFVLTDPGQISQVLMNLAVNARDAMPDGGTFTITTRTTELDQRTTSRLPYPVQPGTYHEIAMTDTGHGMDQETLARIFEPFFTTKEPGQGTGLGLPTVYGIVEQSGGFILVDSNPGQGTTFRIFLPSVPGEESSPDDAANPPVTARGETILVVEDEPAVRMVTRRILESRGYQVIEAGGGEEALHLAEIHRGRIDLVLTDVVMPGLSGAAMAERLRQRHPDLPIIYMSGYTDDQVIRHGVRQDQTHFLQKPFEAHELAEKVREVLG